MSFVAFRGHIVETCSLPICLSLCDYLWEQVTLSSLNLFCKPNFLQLLKRLVKPFCVHEPQRISIWMYRDRLILNLINWILHFSFSLKSLLWSLWNNQMWVVTYVVEKDWVFSYFWDNLCIVTLIFQLYNVFNTYALVILSLQRIPNHYMFYLNGLIFYLLLLILNCWGRFVLPVSFWKRDILK